jgi:hypothetical protein
MKPEPVEQKMLEYETPNQVPRSGRWFVWLFGLLPGCLLLLVSWWVNPETGIISGPRWAEQAARADREQAWSVGLCYAGLAWMAVGAVLVYFRKYFH